MSKQLLISAFFIFFISSINNSFSKVRDKEKLTTNSNITQYNSPSKSKKISNLTSLENNLKSSKFDSNKSIDGSELHSKTKNIKSLRKYNEAEIFTFDEKLKPFYHGVASGDPLSDRVIIWTRITKDFDDNFEVAWDIATDKFMKNIIKSGKIITNQEKDYTVKIDANELNSSSTYYYQFTDMLTGEKSIIGRTRTAPNENDNNKIEKLRFAMISCVNYQWGYFNALERIAERQDLDAVIHLGDYFYEYADDYYKHPNLKNRNHIPSKETIELSDYRVRFSQYRLDPMLRKLHQQHPMIATWDDHESTNDSWSGGAQNHNENEGSWENRVIASTTAYDEWMPIRSNQNKKNIYRKFNYGNLVDIFMLETRLSGREEPMAPKGGSNNEVDTLKWQDPNRTMLGFEQLNWLLNGLKESKAKWKLIGSSIMMVPIPPSLITNMDAWDGYPAEREKICGFISANNIKNVGVLSGDFHMSFASNVLSVLPENLAKYNPQTADGTATFEFTTPSVSSANLNEQETLTLPGIGVIKPLEMELPERSQVAQLLEMQVVSNVPWIKYMNSDQHGYVLLDIKNDKIQGDWYLMENILEVNKNEFVNKSAFVNENTNLINFSNEPAPNKLNSPDLAPWDLETSIKVNNENDDLLVFGNYPNPIIDFTLFSLAINKPGNVKIQLFDMTGKVVNTIIDEFKAVGVYGIPFDASNLKIGNYFYTVIHNDKVVTKKLYKIK